MNRFWLHAVLCFMHCEETLGSGSWKFQQFLNEKLKFVTKDFLAISKWKCQIRVSNCENLKKIFLNGDNQRSYSVFSIHPNLPKAQPSPSRSVRSMSDIAWCTNLSCCETLYRRDVWIEAKTISSLMSRVHENFPQFPQSLINRKRSRAHSTRSHPFIIKNAALSINSTGDRTENGFFLLLLLHHLREVNSSFLIVSFG